MSEVERLELVVSMLREKIASLGEQKFDAEIELNAGFTPALG